jgi:hypothetical protein
LHAVDDIKYQPRPEKVPLPIQNIQIQLLNQHVKREKQEKAKEKQKYGADLIMVMRG